MMRAICALVLALAAGAVQPAASGRGVDLAPAKLALRGAAHGWPQAYATFDAAAREGDAGAAYYLALMHKNGMGAPRDSTAAARWLERAAAGGIPPAMFLLANMLYNGDGVARDEVAARAWIERAADLEYPEAALLMAQGLRDGSMGFERDPERAEQQFKEAAHDLQHRPPEP